MQIITADTLCSIVISDPYIARVHQNFILKELLAKLHFKGTLSKISF